MESRERSVKLGQLVPMESREMSVKLGLLGLRERLVLQDLQAEAVLSL
jgi:hypothetical protein